MTYTTTKVQALKSYPTYQFYADADPKSVDTDSVFKICVLEALTNELGAEKKKNRALAGKFANKEAAYRRSSGIVEHYKRQVSQRTIKMFVIGRRQIPE